jgi:hypothetical protein
MDYKPGDLFIGVIDFFGILVPGAVLLFLYGESLAKPLALSLDQEQTPLLIAFFVGSYVLGHFLLGIGVHLNCLLCVYQPQTKDAFYKAIKDKIDLPEGVAKTRTNVFYRAYAFVRLNSPSALTEIERQMADYKLFRSLTVVFGLDLILTAICGVPHLSRLLFSGTLFIIAAWRFLFLLSWTYRITFEYYAILKSPHP